MENVLSFHENNVASFLFMQHIISYDFAVQCDLNVFFMKFTQIIKPVFESKSFTETNKHEY